MSGVNGRYDAIVIGSGIAGLTAARFLAEYGRRVLILEKHDVAGGMTHTFKRKGYEWDVGLHYIGGNVGSDHSIIRWMFDYVTDGQLQWREMDEVFDRVQIGGDDYEMCRGRAEQEAALVRHFPNEAANIKKYFDLIEYTAFRGSIYFPEKTMPPWLSFIFGRPMRRGFLKYAGRTTYDVIRSITDNEKLISVLCAQCGDYAMSPKEGSFGVHALVVEHYLRGGFYPVGGGRRIFETIEPGLKSRGVEIRLKTAVDEILLESGRVAGVRLQTGETISAPVVVSGAGARSTFTKFIPGPHPFAERVRKDLARLQPSIGHIGLYAGLNASDAELNLPNCNYWIYDSYDFDGEFQKFKNSGGKPGMAYLSFGSRRDGGWDRPDKSTFQVLAPCMFDRVSNWQDTKWRRRGQDYEDFKAQQKEWLLQRALDIVPQIKPHIEHVEVSTPLSTKHFGAAPMGEMYGLEHSPLRFQVDWLRPRTPIKGLFLTGQDTISVGVTAALFAGMLTAVSILHRPLPWQVWRQQRKKTIQLPAAGVSAALPTKA